jgi:Fe2+ transport system protein FeoA
LNLTNLVELGNGRSARVVELRGGHHSTGKLEAMGIAPGVTIMKKSASLMKGPIVLKAGAMQFAVGYGMALRIVLEPLD